MSWIEAASFCNWLTSGDAYVGAYQFDGSGTLTGVDRNAAVSAHGTVYVLPTIDEWDKAAYFKPDATGYSLYASGLDTVPTPGTTNGWNYKYIDYVNGSPNFMWESGFGGDEQNGTFDMMGNVWEWNESAGDGTLDNMTEDRRLRGGSAFTPTFTLSPSVSSFLRHPATEIHQVGFRVAVIPEPSSIAMIGLLSGCAVFIRRFFCI